jgi:deoxyribodipyrimidine photo-lyase
MREKTILVWFRNDLRIHDNEILLEAARKADKVLPVYCFDPWYFTHTAAGNVKTGAIRAKFLLESVADLRNNLRNIGGELLIRFGNPAEILPALAEEYQVNEIYHHREVAHEETAISEQVEGALWKQRLNLKHFIGHTLYHKEDLPFPIKDIPDSFAVFKKKAERDSTVRRPLATPEKISTPAIADAGELPTLADLGVEEPLIGIQFTGGESTGLAQLHKLLNSGGSVTAGKASRLSAKAFSSKLSPWIALGCLSMRQVYWEVTNYQQSNGTNQFNAILLDLLWRDYFRFMFKKHGQKFIAAKPGSIAPSAVSLQQDVNFETWKSGATGIPLVDSIMSDLNTTGYINNYSRQIVAGFLVNELKVDWVKGAAYFEEKLIDYSPASNWGNWAFIAGVNNAAESRYQVAARPVAEAENKLV